MFQSSPYSNLSGELDYKYLHMYIKFTWEAIFGRTLDYWKRFLKKDTDRCMN